MCRVVALSIILLAGSVHAQTKGALQPLLEREIIGKRQTLVEAQTYLLPLVPEVPKFNSATEWQKYADKVRHDILNKVIFRGEAARWRDAKCQVEWQETIAGGPEYRIKKLRYEALPGLWIPAVLYEPIKLSGKVPATLNVMGHDRGGKDVEYQQIRCINLAKRGILALNVEWFAFGQLGDQDNRHSRMNQLDLCGTSGIAPFFLAQKRGLDVLLSHENADPERVAVSGLSGGGWQTIFISSLDTRVKLANPVAGYSSFRTRLKHFKDLGDSEQTPCDLATVADYDHLTAMLAPRAALLTFNAKDNCCFEAGYALPPLMEVALPAYGLFGKKQSLRSHVNHVPGTHNYEQENREAFYRMIGDHFFAGEKNYRAEEIPCNNELKNRQELAVAMPAENATFHSLALALSKNLPIVPEGPIDKEARRARLRDLVMAKEYEVKAGNASEEKHGNLTVRWRPLQLSQTWTVPVVELVPAEPKGTTIVVHDEGRTKAGEAIAKLLAKGQRVLAVDPYYFGEAQIASHAYLFALTTAAVGERPLGIQASQVAAVARWAEETKAGAVDVLAIGPRSSLISLVAGKLEPKAINGVATEGALASLRQIIEQNRTYEEMPECFCFGLLKEFDIPQLR